MKTIVFDFNGTILDDVDLSLKCLNGIVKKYGVRDALNLDEYREVFDFPVIDYYRNVGFDFSKASFEEVGSQWMEYYNEAKNEYRVMEGAIETLIKSKAYGNTNVLISASKHDNLLAQCEELELMPYFDEIIGIDNIYAPGKIDIVKVFMKDKDPNDVIFIGDTLHDAEVAKSVGAKCYLVANGHQSYKRLLKSNVPVYKDIREVPICE